MGKKSKWSTGCCKKVLKRVYKTHNPAAVAPKPLSRSAQLEQRRQRLGQLAAMVTLCMPRDERVLSMTTRKWKMKVLRERCRDVEDDDDE